MTNPFLLYLGYLTGGIACIIAIPWVLMYICIAVYGPVQAEDAPETNEPTNKE